MYYVLNDRFTQIVVGAAFGIGLMVGFISGALIF